MDLNKNELLIGFIFGISFVVCMAALAVPVAFATAFLWAIGGRYGHGWRVWLVPAVVCLAALLMFKTWIPLISYPLGAAVLSIGYGIPSTQPPDEGSFLGRLWFNLFKGNEAAANLFTRGTIYALLVLAFIPVYVLKVKP